MIYNIGNTIHYIMDGKLCSAPVMSIMTVENNPRLKPHNDEQRRALHQFGSDCVKYATVHGVVNEENAYPTRADLIAALVSGDEE